MEDFINSKLDIVGMRRYIDWDTLRLHHRQLSPHRRATRLKCIYRWAPTNAQSVKTRQGEDPFCPLCYHNHETTQHVLECTAEAANSHRQRAQDHLENDLVAASTCPHLTTLIIAAISLPRDEDLVVHTTESRF